MEQFYLLKEIGNFYHVSPHLLSHLQKWLIEKSNEILKDYDGSSVVQQLALDILEWAPLETKVCTVSCIKIAMQKSCKSKFFSCLKNILVVLSKWFYNHFSQNLLKAQTLSN